MWCKLFGHNFDPHFEVGNPRFIKLWDGWLGEPTWFEQFIHTCLRCKKRYIISRWTRAAAAKMIEEE